MLKLLEVKIASSSHSIGIELSRLKDGRNQPIEAHVRGPVDQKYEPVQREASTHEHKTHVHKSADRAQTFTFQQRQSTANLADKSPKLEQRLQWVFTELVVRERSPETGAPWVSRNARGHLRKPWDYDQRGEVKDSICSLWHRAERPQEGPQFCIRFCRARRLTWEVNIPKLIFKWALIGGSDALASINSPQLIIIKKGGATYSWSIEFKSLRKTTKYLKA